MRLVTVFALHIHAQVHFMLPDPRDARMAPETIVIGLWLHLADGMRLMAFIAVELHGRLFVEYELPCLCDRGIVRDEESHVHGRVFDKLLAVLVVRAVAIQAFLTSGPKIPGPVGMAVDAGQSSHAFAVHRFTFVALGAELLCRKETMQTALIRLDFAMTLCAFDLLHVYVFCVEQRFIDALGLSLSVTRVTVLRAYDNLALVTLRHFGRTVQHKADKQLVLLRNGEMMAIMAVERFMLARSPAVIR